jgi:hypothetical protein
MGKEVHRFVIRKPRSEKTSWGGYYTELRDRVVVTHIKDRLSAVRQSILTDSFPNFLQFLQKNNGIISLNRPRLHSSTS